MTIATTATIANVRWFSELGLADLEQVGGKNSSLGEMVSNLSSAGVLVPDGFATTADAYRRFLGEILLALPGVKETRTYAVMEEVKSEGMLPV